MHNFPHYIQLDAMDCGPTCLRMIAKFYGKSYSLQTLRSRFSLRAKECLCWESVMRQNPSDSAHPAYG